MGAGPSVPSKLTRQDVYNLTKSTRDTMNVLLDYMLKEISIRDFYLLSNPSECKKYVLFLTNTLYKQFYELGIEVAKDRKGSLFFRPIKELVEVPESEKVERQSLCLILAYFYTRIFQIFGALALTLIDDANVMTSSGLLINSSTDNTRRLLAPGARPYVTMGGSAEIKGGAGVDLGVFNFMRNYLDLNQYESTYGYQVISPGNDIYFKIGTKVIGSGYTPGTFTIFTRGAKQYFNLDITVEPEDFKYSKVLVKLIYVRFTKKGDTKVTRIDFPSDIAVRKVHFERDTTPLPPGKYADYDVVGTDKSVGEYFQGVFSKLIPYVRALMEDDVGYISSYTGYTSGKNGTKTYLASDKDVAEELRLERTIHNLVRQKPLGHCIARALQLLNTVSLKGDSWESNICKANFLVAKDGTIRSGLVKPGDTLDMSPGMSALSQLFYDTVRYGLPKVTMSEQSLVEYVEFMKRMAILYGDYKTPTGTRSDSDLAEKGLKGIKDKRDGELCKGQLGTTIRVPNEASKDIYQYVNMLYKIQLEHSKKAGAIFQLLFNAERDKSTGRFRITFNDNILKKGIPEINRINIAARKVLTEYYENCETTYLQGMGKVLEATRPKPMTPPPIIPPPIIPPTTKS